MTTIAQDAREAGIAIPLEGYQPVENFTLTAPGDHTHKGEITGRYFEGDDVHVFDLMAEHLRELATDSTASRRLSAVAKTASKELARRKANRGPKKARKALVVEALVDAGIYEWVD